MFDTIVGITLTPFSTISVTISNEELTLFASVIDADIAEVARLARESRKETGKSPAKKKKSAS